MENRIQRDARGDLDEVVTDGGAHLERMDKDRWFLNCVCSDGSSYALWIHGKVVLEEEREAPAKETLARQVAEAKAAATKDPAHYRRMAGKFRVG